ncbi:SPFH domain-containing protein [Dasania sp. GY-MA-18]|uniref:SPFH domain-containing protein n=1 Tax=Dasania phycosphaerae TaxID=2950436 RepID=A0A9J6RJ94_9GAMM|nr:MULTISPECIES: SPFH domain-containing protein [Dasania]MCR8922338.1 SPFH domain-containing protein [Dasania sp. GY-MA-18]MCZ0864766.1 SPFH domain-containing protein [Dasania phycosphaerae]MCZ0868494.1 SPFH domain-containing protein [Dasania phycosphaerae]
MFNIQYIKAEPTTFIMQYKNGQLKRQGKGLSFFYYAPTTSLVSVPVGTTDLPFMLKESTKDYQEVTVQGQVVYRIADPEMLSGLMNFTLKPNASGYSSEDPDKLRNRIVNLVQVKMRTAIEQLDLRQAIAASQTLVRAVKNELSNSSVLQSMGIEIMDLSILAIKPSPDTARALEAAVREKLLEEADEAIYRRRNASIDQERAVKENELNTELAVEAKQKDIKEERLKAERLQQEKRSEMEREQLEADIVLEQQRKEFVELATANEREEADVKAYEIAATMEALSKVEPRIFEAMTMANLNPQQLMAQAFRELAGGAEKIGQLNIAPDLLQSIAGKIDGDARA